MSMARDVVREDSVLAAGLREFLGCRGYGWDGRYVMLHKMCRLAPGGRPGYGTVLGGVVGSLVLFVSGELRGSLFVGDRLGFVGFIGDPGVLDRLVGWLEGEAVPGRAVAAL